TLCSFIKSSCGSGGAIFPRYFEGNWYLGFSNLKLRTIIVNGAFSLSIESNNFLVSLILTGYFVNEVHVNRICSLHSIAYFVLETTGLCILGLIPNCKTLTLSLPVNSR